MIYKKSNFGAAKSQYLQWERNRNQTTRVCIFVMDWVFVHTEWLRHRELDILATSQTQ